MTQRRRISLGKLADLFRVQHLRKYIPRVKGVAILGAMIRKTSGGNHAWYKSNFGPVRKPIV